MKIALLPRIDKIINPETTSSRPLIVYNLAKGLIELGHEVTTFTTADSDIPGNIVPIASCALEKMGQVENSAYRTASYTSIQIEEAIKRSAEFDIIHNHIYPEFWPILANNRFKSPLVTTIHTQITPDMNQALSYYPDTQFIALSQAQKTLGKNINYVDVVYNGIDVDRFNFNDLPKNYLLFFGRMKEYKDKNGNAIDPKGVTKAISVAKKTGDKLIIAGNIENPVFYNDEIKPNLSDKIKFIGPISAIGPIKHEQKVELYRNAKALLNPIDWEEPFGLTMIEAMACGTPVISFDRGSAKEVIKNGQTGFITQTENEMVNKISELPTISRLACRKHVEERFTLQHMAKNYEIAFQNIINN